MIPEDSVSRGTSERERLVNAHHQASRDFDRAVMTLAAGALGLSIAFVKEIAGPRPTATLALALAWSFFAGSLLMIMASLLTSQFGLLRQIDAIDKSEELFTPGGRFGQLTTWLNLLGAGTLVAGVVCLVVFAFRNI